MTFDPMGSPLRPWTYGGFSSEPDPAPARRRPTLPRAAAVGGGVAIALALGLGLGFVAKPDLGHPSPAPPMKAVTADADRVPPVRIVETVPPAAPAASAAIGDKLQVLAPETARVALAAPPRPPAASRPLTDAAGPPAPVAGKTCAEAPSLAARSLCEDPALAAADQAMGRAYRRALHAGADPDRLQDDQQDWLAAREQAARRSPAALAAIYDQRIDELKQIADDGPA